MLTPDADANFWGIVLMSDEKRKKEMEKQPHGKLHFSSNEPQTDSCQQASDHQQFKPEGED